MNLFVKPKNKVYNIVTELINYLSDNPKGYMTSEEIKDYLQDRGMIDEKIINSILKENEDINANIDLLFKSDDDNYYMLECEQNIEIQPYIMEKIWLKNILNDSKMNLFLKEGTINALKKSLLNIDDIMIEGNLVLKNVATIDTEEIETIKNKMKIIIKAIKEKKGIKYNYTTKYGEIFNGRSALPIKIEYSIKDDLFYLISYPLDEEKPRPIKSLVKNFYDIELINLDVDYDKIYEACIKDIEIKKVNTPIVLEINNNNNALERAFHLFACFDKKAKYISDKDVYLLYIYYYGFEEKEILSRIFSLGKEVFVIGPKEIQDEVRELIKTVLINY